MDKYESSFQLPVRAPAGGGGGGGGGGGRTNLASSCAVAAAFLLLASSAGAATLFFLFRPRDPAVRVTAVQLPGFSLLRSNGSSIVSGFSFSEHAAVRNPNRAAFSHYDSRIRLLHAGSQVGFMYIPAGEIGGGRTQFMAATFSVASFPVSPPGGGGPSLEVEARMELRGRVRVLKVFVHRVVVVESCRIAVRAGDGSVIGVRC